MAAEGIRAGRAYVELGVDNAAFVRGLNNASRQLKSFGRSMMTAGAAITAPLLAASKAFAKIGDDLDKMSKRTGVSVESLSKLQYVVETSGASMEDFERAFSRMQKEMGSGDAEANLKAFAQHISELDDPTQQAAETIRMFGMRAGPNLLPMLKQGADGIDALMQKAKDLGLEISTAQADAAAKFNDELTGLWMTIKKASFEVGAALVPSIQSLVEFVRSAILEFMAWTEENKTLLNLIFKLGVALTVIGAVLYGAGVAAGILTTILGGLTTAIGAVNVALAFLAANPVVLVIGAVLALGVALASVFGLFDKKVKDIKKGVSETGDETDAMRKKIDAMRAEMQLEMQTPEVPEITQNLRPKGVTLGQEFDARNMALSKYFLSSSAVDETADRETHRKLDGIAEILRNNRVAYVED